MQRSTFALSYPSGSGACKTNEIFNSNTVAELSSVNLVEKVTVAALSGTGGASIVLVCVSCFVS